MKVAMAAEATAAPTVLVAGRGTSDVEEAVHGRPSVAVAAEVLPAHPAQTRQSSDMPTRSLGRTGEPVSTIGLGGYHIGLQPDEQESITLIHSAIDWGITFMDNCWDYHNGASELRMSKALRDGYRQKVFLKPIPAMSSRPNALILILLNTLNSFILLTFTYVGLQSRPEIGQFLAFCVNQLC